MTSDRFLEGKRAVVTGGGKGIGLAISRRLSKRGAMVVMAGRNRDALMAAAEDINAAGGAVDYRVCDVAEEQDVLELFAAVESMDGIDILINNAGMGRFGPVMETSVADWDAVMGTNLRGAFLCSREAMLRMRERGGRIISIGSVVSFKGYVNQGAYSASKHGLLGLTKVIGAEGQKYGIIAQAVCPGGVATDMAGTARPDLDRSGLMLPEDVADAVEFLLRQRGNAATDCIQLRRMGNSPWQ